jgi:hypothetical protein
LDSIWVLFGFSSDYILIFFELGLDSDSIGLYLEFSWMLSGLYSDLLPILSECYTGSIRSLFRFDLRAVIHIYALYIYTDSVWNHFGFNSDSVRILFELHTTHIQNLFGLYVYSFQVWILF